jgi:hypothetical protein
MTKLHLKYVQSFGGYHYFRRRGMPRIPLPGIVGSPEFMAAYQQALAAAPVAIGASTRSKPGSVSAALAEYFQSNDFRTLTGESHLIDGFGVPLHLAQGRMSGHRCDLVRGASGFGEATPRQRWPRPQNKPALKVSNRCGPKCQSR